MVHANVKSGEGEILTVLGMPLRFLRDASDTNDAWSLMEEDVALGLGPAPHRHDWDEAYYVVSGAVDFVINGDNIRAETGDFVNIPKNSVHAFKGGSEHPHAC
jgi:mannose-6-phosphate isomerase-like protein (cupin superfamily)